MLFGMPITWIIAELLALIIFFLCLIHASRRTDSIYRIMELFGFVIAAAIFENIGVWQHIYDYNLNRIMLIGKVPLHILLIEASIVYAALIFVDHIDMPDLCKALIVGLLSSVQDMTLDPASVFDTYEINGAMSGQWNWTEHYQDMFFDIPFFNFSGWFSMTAIFAFFVFLGRKKKEQKPTSKFWNIYPLFIIFFTVLVMVSPINTMLLFLFPVVPMYTRTAELIMMILLHGSAILLLILYNKKFKNFDFKSDKIVFWLPATYHVYAIAIAFIAGIEKAYVPCILFTVIHLAYMFYIYKTKTHKVN